VDLGGVRQGGQEQQDGGQRACDPHHFHLHWTPP
jgi:hypothetical protein